MALPVWYSGQCSQLSLSSKTDLYNHIPDSDLSAPSQMNKEAKSGFSYLWLTEHKNVVHQLCMACCVGSVYCHGMAIIHFTIWNI